MGSRSAASRSRSAAPRPDGPARSRSSTNRKYAGTVPMSLSLRQLHPIFAAEATGVDLSTNLPETTIAEIRAALDRHAVLVFPDQHLDDKTQLAFAGRFGPIEPPQAYSGARRLKHAEFADVSNLDADNRPRPPTKPLQIPRCPNPRPQPPPPPAGRPAPHDRARHPPLAHRRLVPPSPGGAVDALCAPDPEPEPERRRRDRVRRFARRL